MNMAGIRNLFTEEVTKYINQGYVFSTSMAGHQGEMMKVDLENGTDTIRIRLESDSKWDNETFIHFEIITITTEKFNEVPTSTFHTLWNGKGETISTKSFIKIAEDYLEEDSEESRNKIALRWDRYSERRTPDRIKKDITKVAKENKKEWLLDLIHTLPRTSSVKVRHIESVKYIKEVLKTGEVKFSLEITFKGNTATFKLS